MLFILGPCVIESGDHAVRMARAIQAIAGDFIFKASFDKANRSSIAGFRGPGLARGLETLANVYIETGLRVTTDFHTPDQAGPVAEVCDVIQVPALLSRQTDMLVEAGRAALAYGRTVNIKKGQFMAPEDMRHAIDKVRSAGDVPIWVTERGTSFGYHNLVVDMRSIPIMRRLGVPVIVDATHAVQRPAAGDGCSTGEPEHIPTIASAAVAAGADGVFMEVHDDPAHALSDGPNSLRLDALEGVLRRLLRIEEAACGS